MANMSYCRFHNTKLDLEDCIDAIRDEEELSEEEARAGKSMFDSFLSFCVDLDIINGYDRDAVMDLFDGLKEKEDCE